MMPFITCVLKVWAAKGTTHAGVGMDEFEQLMAASAMPNLLDDHEVMPLPRGDVDAMTPEPVMHARHMDALGITPPRSLLSSFAAAARAGVDPSVVVKAPNSLVLRPTFILADITVDSRWLSP